jgi:hypothetical protein
MYFVVLPFNKVICIIYEYFGCRAFAFPPPPLASRREILRTRDQEGQL